MILLIICAIVGLIRRQLWTTMKWGCKIVGPLSILFGVFCFLGEDLFGFIVNLVLGIIFTIWAYKKPRS